MIRAASLRGFVDLVDELGGDHETLLHRFGLDSEVLGDDDGLIPITAHDLMLDTAAHELNCPDFGLRLAETQDLSILGPLAVAIEASSTVADALDCASRYLFVHSPALGIEVEADPLGRDGVVALTYRKDLRESTYSPQGMELGLGVFYRVAVSLLGGLPPVRSVLISHPPLSPVQGYLDYFGTDVKFGSNVAALCIQRHLLEETFTGANEAIRAVAIDYLTQHFRDPRETLAAQVRLGIAEALRTSRPTMASISRLFTIHPRTLQRRLSAEGTSFAAILDEVRREAAHRYLTTTDLSVGQIAFMVGFSEQSSLTHAIRRWYGTSPRALRAAFLGTSTLSR